MKRRKYVYADREAAENAAKRYESLASDWGCAISLWFRDDGDAKSRRQIGNYESIVLGADRADGGYVLIVYRRDGQSPSVTIYDDESLGDMRKTMWHVTDPEGVQLRELIDWTLRTQEALRREAWGLTRTA